jgi:hypothetical protein
VEVKFSDDQTAIVLSGPFDEVQAVQKCLETRFVNAICHDTLKLDLPGELLRFNILTKKFDCRSEPSLGQMELAPPLT